MARIEWFNMLYPEARIDVIEVSESGQVKMSQPEIVGRRPSTFSDLASSMAADGWEPVFRDRTQTETNTFFHPGHGVYMTDVSLENGRVVTGPDGEKRFQPFDVVIVVPED